jgi:hypothetical protein
MNLASKCRYSFVSLSDQTAIVYLYKINWAVFKTEELTVCWEIKTEFVYKRRSQKIRFPILLPPNNLT